MKCRMIGLLLVAGCVLLPASYARSESIPFTILIPSQNAPTDAEQVAGPGQIGAIWIHPQALRTLRVGQVIDQDNIVQTRVAVTRADAGVVQITEAGKLHSTTCQYDTNTGVMSALNHTDQHAYTQTTLNLVR